MSVENSCISIKCSAECCHDIVFNRISEEDFTVLSKLHHNAIENSEESFGLIAALIGSFRDRVLLIYAVHQDQTYSVALFGPCSNLVDYECAIYESRPNACRNLQIDSENCKEARVRAINGHAGGNLDR